MPKALRIAYAFIFIGAALLFPSAAFADTASDSRVAQELSSQIDLADDSGDKTPEKTSPERVAYKNPEEPETVASDTRTFDVKSVRLEGNARFSAQELAQYYRPLENRTVTFAELKDAMRGITRHYQSRGFMASRAYLDNEPVKDGVLTIKILEARIGKILLEGNRYYGRHVYEKLLKPGSALNVRDTDRALHILNEKPGIRAKAYLSEGASPGEEDVYLKLDESHPVRMYYGYNNRGTKLTHVARHSAHFEDANLFGLTDSFKSRFFMSEEGAVLGGGAEYELPFDETGTVLSLKGDYVDTKLIGFAKTLELKGYYFNIEPGIQQYFVREPGFDLSLGASFEFKDFKTLRDDLKSSFDRMRVVKAGPRVSWIDPWGNSEARADVHQGIPEFFGGSDAEDNATSNRAIGTGGQFTYYTAEAQRIQKLFFPGFILLRGTGQWSRESLTTVEQIRIGGLYSVRGYPTADAIGDYGYDFTAELDVPIYFIPSDWKVPGFHKTWWQAVQLVGFIDGGKTFTRERSFSTEPKDRFLLGTGGGARVNLKPNFSLEVYIGVPIGDRSSDENNPITHVALTAGF